MSVASASLERRALSLGTANAIDFGLQFLLPIVLTRTLDAHAFGEWRLLWLAVATLMSVAPMCMGESLYYFLPRSDAPTRRLHVNQTMAYLAVAGALCAWALSGWNPLLPGSLGQLIGGHGPVVPAFVLLWVFASLLDVLPTAEERVAWQSRAIVSLSAVRAVALSLTAYVTRDLGAVLVVLLAFAGLKAAILVWYVARHHGLLGPIGRASAFKAQVRQAAPFAISGALHGVRYQSDQWIAAALFPVSVFASFSVGTVIGPIAQIFRQSVNHVFLPSMSRLQSAGDVKAMLALNARANTMVALVVYPMIAFAFVFAADVVALIYTRTYLDAVPVMRIYIVGIIAFVVEVVSILFVLQQGGFAARVNLLVLSIAIPLSLFGAMRWGLWGAALGSVAAVYAERVISLRKIAVLTGTPISRQQDWKSLAGILAAAAVAAAACGFVVHAFEWSAFARLAAGGALLAIAYPLALAATGQLGAFTAFVRSLRASRS